MKLLSVTLCMASLVVACANREGTSPNVPEPAIEKAASTKIPDADGGPSEPAEPSESNGTKDGAGSAAPSSSAH